MSNFRKFYKKFIKKKCKSKLKKVHCFEKICNRYKEMLMINDSCGAATIFEKLTAPNIFGLGSSSRE